MYKCIYDSEEIMVDYHNDGKPMIRVSQFKDNHFRDEHFVELPVDVVEVVHGRWELTAHEEYSNYRWNVTAECSECHRSKGEIYAGFFTGFPKDLARSLVLDCAKKVKLDNYCPNCGAKMDGDGNG